eukprot:scaffold35212_cov101-Isochrysis_galbana.AAC.3
MAGPSSRWRQDAGDRWPAPAKNRCLMCLTRGDKQLATGYSTGSWSIMMTRGWHICRIAGTAYHSGARTYPVLPAVCSRAAQCRSYLYVHVIIHVIWRHLPLIPTLSHCASSAVACLPSIDSRKGRRAEQPKFQPRAGHVQRSCGWGGADIGLQLSRGG